MAEQTADASTDVKSQFEIKGTRRVRFDDADTVTKGGTHYKVLVVERDGEEVEVPFKNVQVGTQYISYHNPNGSDGHRPWRSTRTYDRVFAEETPSGSVRFVAEREAKIDVYGRVSHELIEDLDDDGEPLGTFSTRTVQTERLDEHDNAIHPDEIDHDSRVRIWERPFDGRIGPKMRRAVRLVGAGPEPSKNQVAKAVGPHGSQDYGYRIVNRCLGRGLLRVDPDHPEATPSGQGAVVITKRGEAFLEHLKEDDN